MKEYTHHPPTEFPPIAHVCGRIIVQVDKINFSNFPIATLQYVHRITAFAFTANE